jgi:hypothetical protein
LSCQVQFHESNLALVCVFVLKKIDSFIKITGYSV